MSVDGSIPRWPGAIPQPAAKLIDALPEQVENMIRSCGYVLDLTARARAGQQLEVVEIHVLAYLLKPLGESGIALFHQLMGRVPGYSADWGRMKLNAVPPTLISCRKIQQRLVHLTGVVQCGCAMPQDSM